MGNDQKQPVNYKIFFTKRCEHIYKKLQGPEKQRIGKAIDELSKNPLIGYPLKGSTLGGLYSYHAGDFRIVYKFSSNPAEMEIWAVGHRKHVYDELERYMSATK